MGAFQTFFGGGNSDVFVTKLNTTGTILLYSTYIGGVSIDVGNSITVNASGNAYITGSTNSTNYDVTPGAFQTIKAGIGGTYDVFVTMFNTTGSALLYSTYIGGNSDDGGASITLDASGNAYVTGSARSGYDITVGSYQTSNAGLSDVFVTKLNATGTALLYSTFIGGSGLDYGSSISLDASNNAYITGYTFSTDYDITTGAFQTTNAGNADVFVTKLNATGTALIYSTYIGGTVNDYGSSSVLDAANNVYINGYTGSTDYDITMGAFQTTNEGGLDVFVTKLDLTGITTISEIATTNLFSVFPNPSQGVYQIVLKNTNSTDEVLVEVYNLQGKLIYNKNHSNKNGINLNLSKEPNGIYMVKITDKQSSQAVKLIKQ